jgi:hypothetical protein
LSESTPVRPHPCRKIERVGLAYRSSIIAISLAVLAAVAVHDSLALQGTMIEEEENSASCEQPQFRS